MASRLFTSNLIRSHIHTTRLQLRAMSTENDVLFDTVGDKGIITLNRPKALNALNLSMAEKILPVLEKWEHDKTLVLIKGAGDKAFCAGGDVRAVTEAGLRGDRYANDFFRKEYTMNGMIGTYKVPYIAFIDGIVMGGGVGLSVHGHYRIATERTLFAMPETQIGLFPDVGGSYFLPRLGGKLGLYLALTGVRLKGADVLKSGIATHYVSSSTLDDLQAALLKCCNESDITETLKKFTVCDDKEFSLKPHMEKINKCFGSGTIEEILANLETDASQWAQDTLKLLRKMSPTSLKVTIKELEEGAKMNLLECLQMEYRLACNTLKMKDFYEGVRALLIDKDQSPKWDPSDIKDVSATLVNSHFAKLPESEELKHKL